MCTPYAEEWTWEILLIAIVGAALAALILISLIYLFVCCCRGNRADVSDGSIILQFRKNKTQPGEGVTSGNQTQAYDNPGYSHSVPTENNAQTDQGVASENQESAYSDVGPPRHDPQTAQCVPSENQENAYSDVVPSRNDPQTGQGVTSGAAIYGNAAIAENKKKQRNEGPKINGQADTGK